MFNNAYSVPPSDLSAREIVTCSTNKPFPAIYKYPLQKLPPHIGRPNEIFYRSFFHDNHKSVFWFFKGQESNNPRIYKLFFRPKLCRAGFCSHGNVIIVDSHSCAFEYALPHSLPYNLKIFVRNVYCLFWFRRFSHFSKCRLGNTPTRGDRGNSQEHLHRSNLKTILSDRSVICVAKAPYVIEHFFLPSR